MSQRTGYQPQHHTCDCTKRPLLAERLPLLAESWFAKYIAAMRRGDYKAANQIREENEQCPPRS